MTKPDDSSLSPHDHLFIEKRAQNLLDRADAWDRFPVPINDLIAAANLTVAPTSVFDPVAIMAYVTGKAAETAKNVKSAIAKIFGVYDAAENIIHIDDSVIEVKQTFLKLHETGHHEITTHKKLFRLFQDCEKTLAPDISDQFEREANNFARYALFKGTTFASYAADCAFEIKTPIKLAKKFGASIYASMREFARTNPRACVVYVLEPLEYVPEIGARAIVRRIEPSAKFLTQFGQPMLTEITLDHPLGPLLPIGRRMVKPTSVSLHDRNGEAHECIAEAFDTTRNIIILLYPVAALTSTTLILPAA